MPRLISWIPPSRHTIQTVEAQPATVLPRTQTVAAEETSRSVNAAPSSNDHSFTSK